jgi:chromate reductase, NAD(P)H dehydrogenase (quinone)
MSSLRLAGQGPLRYLIGDGRRPRVRRRSVGETKVADQINVLGVAGSLREGSYNRAALRAAIELAPAGMTIETFDLAPIQPYNEDVKQQGFPPPEQEFRDKIRAADALLIVTPEYNRGISGVLKNAIDWASRPPDQPFNGKPAAIFGASPGMVGTAVAQFELRRYLGVLNALVLNTPSVMIGQAAAKFDERGRLTDQPTREIIGQMLAALADWTRRHGR